MSELKCIVSQTMDHDPNRKGNAAELAIAAEAARLELLVYYPLTEHGRTDLVLGIGDRLWRVQCKWGALVGDKIQVRLKTGLFEGRSAVWLRFGQTKNAQRAALNWAADYEFQGAVAQLAERPNGIRKARGSNPLSSIPSEEAAASSEGIADNVIPVGAHQFRNHFGYYMEQAAAGAEVVVSRRGRPYVRMVGS